MQTLKFKAQLTNTVFATVNQTFDGSTQLPITAKHCFIFWTELNDLITVHSAVTERWEGPLNIWSTVAKNIFIVRVCMLLKDAVVYRNWISVNKMNLNLTMPACSRQFLINN